MRSLKTLGPALLAVLAIGALAAPAAQAEQSYHVTSATASLSGSQATANQLHIPGAGTVECSGASFSGSLVSKTSSSLEIEPLYTGCKAFGFATTDFTVTSFCDFALTTPSGLKAAVDISCSPLGKLKITPTFFGASVCTIEIGSQSPSGSVDIANKSENGFSESYLLLTWTLTGIKHTAGCGAAEAANAEYTGTTTLKAAFDRLWVT